MALTIFQGAFFSAAPVDAKSVAGAETAEECMATSPIKKCADMKVTGYTSRVAKCTLSVQRKRQSATAQQCRDTQKVDYDACQYQCQIDWV